MTQGSLAPLRMLTARLPLMALALLLAACGGGADNGGAADGLHVSCLEEPDPGSCRAAKPAYYYDYKTDSCKRFLWGGCRGHVPFETLEDCLRMCKGGD
jgi:hypothetical protein